MVHNLAGKTAAQETPEYRCNNIRHYLIREAAEISDNRFSEIQSLRDWEKVRPMRYEQFIEMMGIQDMPLKGKRPDLNVKITGVVQEDGYRIEKLYYESLPGLYVPANLYIPDNTEELRPAILYVCGHAGDQKVSYQDHPRKFAQLGFVCLIIETIQWGEVHGEHHGCYARGWFNWYSRGYNPGGVELWNAIRGIDLLTERPEVDRNNIGLTGNSGGGSQSWYIPAIDNRVKAVAPSCGAATLKSHIVTKTIDWHCDCMMPVNTHRWDFQDIGALIAPRPLLIAQSDRDGFNKVESVRQIHNDLNRIYGLYGKTENNRYFEYSGGHGYQPVSGKNIFSFFLKELMGKEVSPEQAGDVDLSPGADHSAEELKVYVNGAPADDRTVKIQDSFVQLATPPEISNRQELIEYKNKVIGFLREKTFGAFPESPPDFDSQLVFQTTDRAKFGSDTYRFVSEEGWGLTLEIRWNYPPAEKKPLMLVLRNAGDQRNEAEQFIANYLEEGWNVGYLEVRGVGDSGWPQDLQWHIRRASAWTGRTISSMQVYDLLRSLDFCRTIKGVDKENMGICARNEMGVVALYTALLDGKCRTLILQNPPGSQDAASRPDGTGPATEMLNCLRITDVYQLPALLPEVEITVAGRFPEKFLWSENVRRKLGKSGITKIPE